MRGGDEAGSWARTVSGLRITRARQAGRGGNWAAAWAAGAGLVRPGPAEERVKRPAWEEKGTGPGGEVGGPHGREGETWAALGRLGFLGWVGFLFIWVFLFSISNLFYF